MKKKLVMILSVLLLFSTIVFPVSASAAESEFDNINTPYTPYTADFSENGNNPEFQKLEAGYRYIMDFAASYNIECGLSLDTYLSYYNPSEYSSIEEYNQEYIKAFDTTPQTRSSGGHWFYNTGTSLPQATSYSQYNFLNICIAGDIVHDANGSFGITGHSGIVEGKYWSSTYNQYYIRIIEAVSDGVTRGVLCDERANSRASSVWRVSGSTSTQRANAVSFARSQLGKSWVFDFTKDTDANSWWWYCSELVWASYKNQGIDIAPNSGIGIMPNDIINGGKVYKIGGV